MSILKQVHIWQVGVALMVVAFLIILALTIRAFSGFDVLSPTIRGWTMTGAVFCALLGKLLEQKPDRRIFQLRGRR